MSTAFQLRVGVLALAFTLAGTATAQDQPAHAGTAAQPSTGSKIGGFFKQFGHSVGRAATQIGGSTIQSITHTNGRMPLFGSGAASTAARGNDGIHGDELDGGMGWNHLVFDPPEIDGYTHIRWGSSAQSRYNVRGTSGEATCDPEYIGLAVTGRTMPTTPKSLTYCLGQEQMLDSSATEDTVRKRIAQLGATRKYYYRGQIVGMFWNTPGQPRLTPTDQDIIIQLLGGTVTGMVQGDFGLSFNIFGPHWSSGDMRSGLYPHLPAPTPPNVIPEAATYKLVVDIDHTKVAPYQLTSLSYIFFSVGTPRLRFKDRTETIYDLPVRIDKIVFVGDGFKSEYDEKEPMP
ncbi:MULTISPECIES: hypothetical protein [Rhodanobacter]|uniref:hypothetical protein n=1 Tax=Rhodanobacter TaxID=75309 RepID=UPI001E342EB5|nr:MULTISPECIES: hypothetical protein [Rhodanobacter]UJJ49906.1 hypothetical protein LRK52_11765 [Rhodanobacter denitrificans]UJM92619.1 hypothetical protein LRK32_11675 [Rhodanobacter denitrificans]UJM96149.1 hypothetical protein LRK44_11680 [Rhodanobacter denitrificans]UJN21020.1 hypothetical protein LRK54_14960 [Rhodanobacter denitrificans]